MNGASTYPEAMTPRCAVVADAAAGFVARLNVLLDQFEIERRELASQGVSVSDTRSIEYEGERALVLAMLSATAEATTKAWTRLNSRPLATAA